MLMSVVLSCLWLAALWTSTGKGLTSWLSCVLCFVTFPNVSLVHIRIKSEVDGAVKQV